MKKSKPEMIEGQNAIENFERGMKRIFQVPKSEVERAEREYKARRKRKKTKASAYRAPAASD